MSDATKTEKYNDEIYILRYCPEDDVIVDALRIYHSDKARFITENIIPVRGAAELGYKRVV